MNEYAKDMTAYLKDALYAIGDAQDLIMQRMDDDSDWYDNKLESDLAAIDNDIREAISYVRKD